MKRVKKVKQTDKGNRVRMKNKIQLMIVASAVLLAGCGNKTALDAKNPTTITVWHYYNGEQMDAFDGLVNEFNETVGKEKGIIVESYGQGSVSDLETNVLAAIKGEVGASEVPNVFAAYADTAYTADMMNEVIDLKTYLTEEEIASYVDGYVEEGDFSNEGEMKIFPIAKCTEVMVINKTDWDAFAAETGVSYESMADMEGLLETAEIYYQWTDAKTPDISGDGKALFGRDAMANYMLIGSMQQGVEIFSVADGKMSLQFDKEAIRKLWDAYYVPFVKGYFAASGRFRSDDLKTGNIIAYVGSSSGASYYPKEVSVSDTESYPIEIEVLPAPQFGDSSGYAVQQGAGMVVTEGTEQEITASVEFLKWFTEDERNIRFAVKSGYLPVKKTANEKNAILNSGIEMDMNMENTLSVSIDTVNSNRMYTTKAFPAGADAREFLENAMSEQAVADREIVMDKLSAGMSLEEAVEEFCSDAYFDAWFETTKSQLEKWETK